MVSAGWRRRGLVLAGGRKLWVVEVGIRNVVVLVVMMVVSKSSCTGNDGGIDGLRMGITSIYTIWSGGNQDQS